MDYITKNLKILVILMVVYIIGSWAIISISFYKLKEPMYKIVSEETITDEKLYTKNRVENVKTLFYSLKHIPYKQREEILKSFINVYNSHNIKKYIFVIKVLNLKGGKKFGIMLINPNVKHLEGKYIDSDFEDAKGNKFRETMLKIINNKGSGFVKYYYKVPNSKKIEEKITYFTYIPEIKWIVASGVYIDEVREKGEELFEEFIELMGYVIVDILFFTIIMALIIGYLYNKTIKNIQQNYEKEKEITKLLSKLDLELMQKNIDFSKIEHILKEIFNHIGVEDFAIYEKDGKLILGNPKLKGEPIHYQNLLFIFKPKQPLNSIAINHLMFAIYKGLEKKRYEEDLEKKIQEQIKEIREKDAKLIMQSKFASLGELVGNISHQWKQPLNALQNNINSLLLDLELGTIHDKELKTTLKKMQDIIKQMEEVINVFKGFYSNNTQKDILSLKDVFKNIKLIFNPQEIKVVYDIDDCQFVGESNALEQVILVIMSNAKDEFNKKNIKGEIDIKAKCLEDEIKIEIEDNAGGIPEEFMDKIFEKFFSTKGSSGIGLALSKEIVEKRLKGKITVTNTDKGAKFIITIPRIKNES
ncbi:MAG: hypothetical protein GXO62_02445 [Epsilonproteobacteria bacterium]|nr:hypothetical protein [Campylobacterota bacterium]